MTVNLTAPGRILKDQELEEVRSKITDTVMETFRLRPMPSGNISEKELEDRLEVTVEIWNHLYGVCRWSKDRALDHIQPLVLAVIDGARLQDQLPEPDEDIREGTTTWAPEVIQTAEAERRLSALAVGDGHVIQQSDVAPCGDKDHKDGGEG